MYKVVEKLAWITGSISFIGVILILFLNGTGLSEEQSAEPTPGKKTIRLTASNRVEENQGEEKVAVKAEPPKPLPIVKETEPKVEKTKPETKTEVIAKPSERKAVSRNDEPEVERPMVSRGALFAESELNQLAGKIQAELIRNNSNTNCIQIRITADNNNAQAVSQVERFLASKNYIITGREKEDFLRGSGLKVAKQGNCLKVTVGRK